MNPWEEITLSDYEDHMSLGSVYQLQAMNKMMKEQFYDHDVSSVMVLGIAGGNGFEHIDCGIFKNVYGVDINQSYLDECGNRYPALKGVFKAICADLTDADLQLPYAELLVANLLIEYIGYENFKRAVKMVRPKYVSCIIQINTDESFVSDSPYLHVFDRLDEVHRRIDKAELIGSMAEIGYIKELQREKELPNRKKLVRIDFAG